MKKEKRNKGKSVLELRDNYVIVDIETTGLDPIFCDIIEISALRVENNVITDRFETLVRPEVFCEADDGIYEGIDYISYRGRMGYFVDDFIINLTGINNQMLLSAPEADKVINDFFSFIREDDVIVGHNINFDINFIYDAYSKYFNKEFTNDYIDTMRISRKALPMLKHHRLSDISNYFEINYENAHRSMADCQITFQCYQSLKEYITFNNISLNVFSKSNPLKAKKITADTFVFDESSPFYQKVFAFTGALEKLTRADAMKIVVNNGGINGDNVTKKTNYLVLGNNDYCPLIKDGKSAKQKKAESYILKGQDLQIISENVFYSMLDEEDQKLLKDKKAIHTFGCCSRYIECSDARECVHKDQEYAKGCAYNQNLKNGKIFYGKNKNI